jgi:predicted phosphodiesterase
VRLGVVSDVHWCVGEPPDAAWHNPFDFAGLGARLERALALFAAAEVDAVVALGDLTHAGDEASMRAALERLAPRLAVAGNHDCLERDDQLARCGGSGAAIEVAGVRVAGVAIETDSRGDAFRWRRDGGPPVADVLASHYPVLSRVEPVAARGLAYSGDLVDRAALAQHAGRDGRPVLVLCGHLHVRDSHAEGPVLQLAAGALVEPPFEVALVDVSRTPAGMVVSRRVHVLGPSAGGRDPVLAPSEETWTYDGGWRASG